VALVILVVAGFRRGYHLQALITPRHFVRLGLILATLSATYIYLTFADLLPGSYVADRGTAAVFTELLVGRLAIWFWLFAIVGGLLPLLLVALPWTRNVPGMVAAALLVVPMMWLKRILMVVGPGTYDTVTGAFGRYHFTWVPVRDHPGRDRGDPAAADAPVPGRPPAVHRRDRRARRDPADRPAGADPPAGAGPRHPTGRRAR